MISSKLHKMPVTPAIQPVIVRYLTMIRLSVCVCTIGDNFLMNGFKWLRIFYHGFLDGLNEPQREAATNINGPVMIIAGPGSSKTRC